MLVKNTRKIIVSSSFENNEIIWPLFKTSATDDDKQMRSWVSRKEARNYGKLPNIT